MHYQKLNLSLPKELIQQTDIQARRDFSSRSDFIRKAIINQLRSEEILTSVLDRANAVGRQLKIASEQQVFDETNDADADNCR